MWNPPTLLHILGSISRNLSGGNVSEKKHEKSKSKKKKKEEVWQIIPVDKRELQLVLHTYVFLRVHFADLVAVPIIMLDAVQILFFYFAPIEPRETKEMYDEI